MKSSLCLILTMILAVGLVEGCGVTTHNVVAHRAMLWYSAAYPEYEEIIRDNQGSFQNGAAFPDWGYSCEFFPYRPSLHAASEAAHWTYFHNQTIHYIRANYQKPWTPKAKRIIAFLLGMVSHATADILWHNLGYVDRSGQGFIQNLAQVNYFAQGNGYGGDAHFEADGGGEFMCAYELDLSFVVTEWHLPSDDLAAIYQSLGFNEVTADVIEICNSEMYAEVHAIATLPSEFIYPHFAAKAPFLVERFQDWWIGGVDDMAVWTTWCWPYMLDWIENGPNSKTCLVDSMTNTPAPYNLVKPGDRISHMIELRQKLMAALGPHVDAISFDIERVDGGVIFRAGNQTSIPQLRNKYINSGSTLQQNHVASDLLLAPKNFNLKTRASECMTQVGSSNNLMFSTLTNYSMLGSSVAKGDFNGDGKDDAVIGAYGYGLIGSPSSGAVYIAYGNTVQGQLSQDVSEFSVNSTKGTALYGNFANDRFGSAIVALDFNMDGFDDLVVSAPGTNSIDMHYKGSVYIYYGNPSGISSKFPDVVISADRKYTNLGFKLRVGDVNGDGADDLLIGSPFSLTGDFLFEGGEVWVFTSSKERSRNVKYGKRDADMRLASTIQGEWLGFDMMVVSSHGNRYLFVSAPQSPNNATSVGNIYAFNLKDFSSSWKFRNFFVPEIIIVGNFGLGKFGFSMDVGKPVDQDTVHLVISCPSAQVDARHFWQSDKPQAGIVFVFPFDSLRPGNQTVDEISMRTTLYADQEFSRLGWQVKFSRRGDGLDDLWISQPYLHDTSILPSGGDAGGGYTFLGGSAFPNGDVYDVGSASSACVQSDRGRSLWGKSSEILDFDGDGKKDLLIGGPRENSNGPNGGRASIVFDIFSQ